MSFLLTQRWGEPLDPTPNADSTSSPEPPASRASTDDTAINTIPACESEDDDERGYSISSLDIPFREFLNHPDVQEAVYELMYHQYTGANLSKLKNLDLVRRLYLHLPVAETLREYNLTDRVNVDWIICCFEVLDEVREDLDIIFHMDRIALFGQNLDIVIALCSYKVDWQWRKYVKFEDKEEDLSDPIWRMYKRSAWHQGNLWQNAIEELRRGFQGYLDIITKEHSVSECG